MRRTEVIEPSCVGVARNRVYLDAIMFYWEVKMCSIQFYDTTQQIEGDFTTKVWYAMGLKIYRFDTRNVFVDW